MSLLLEGIVYGEVKMVYTLEEFRPYWWPAPIGAAVGVPWLVWFVKRLPDARISLRLVTPGHRQAGRRSLQSPAPFRQGVTGGERPRKGVPRGWTCAGRREGR